MTTPNFKAAYRIPEAAEMLSIGRSTLYELITAGAIGTAKIGKIRLVPYAEIEKFLASNMAEAA